MKTITLKQNNVTKNTDYLFTARLDEVLHNAKEVYLNVKSVLGHDNFYLNRNKSDNLVSYSICNNTYTLGHVAVLSADCHMVTGQREYYTDYRFFHYAFAEYKDSIQFYSHSQVINHLDKKYYMNDGRNHESCVSCSPFDYIDTKFETEGEVMDTLCPAHLYEYIHHYNEPVSAEPVTARSVYDDTVKGEDMILSIRGIELIVTPYVHEDYTYYISQSFYVPALRKNVQLDCSYYPAIDEDRDEYPWNGGFHVEDNDFSFHCYRNGGDDSHADLAATFDVLVSELHAIRSINSPFDSIGQLLSVVTHS